jgi:SPP1 family predicted phage head-tail adaptor
MRAGDLKQRIIIQSATHAKNDIGELEDTWGTFATVWAAVEPATGSNYYASKQTEAKVDGRVRIRYRSDLDTTMRILFGSRVLTIVSILQPKENKKETHIMYTEALD